MECLQIEKETETNSKGKYLHTLIRQWKQDFPFSANVFLYT